MCLVSAPDVCVSFGFLVLVGRLWPFFFCPLCFTVSHFWVLRAVEEIFPGSLGVFSGGVYTKAMSLRIPF